MSQKLLHRLSHLEAHHRLGAATLFAVIAFLAAGGHMSPAARLICGWDAYAVALLALSWTRIFTAKPRVIFHLASLQRTGRLLILGVVLLSSSASLAAVAFLLNTAKGLEKGHFAAHIAAAIVTVILSWLVTHTIFALHYAFLYYEELHAGSKGAGLLFPEGDGFEPDYLDFAYYSFVVGMTSQVSDVQVGSRLLRRWTLLHGMISFAFNAAILALSINILSGLI